MPETTADHTSSHEANNWSVIDCGLCTYPCSEHVKPALECKTVTSLLMEQTRSVYRRGLHAAHGTGASAGSSNP